MSEPFGPFRDDVDPVERIAQLRVLRTLVHTYARSEELERNLRDAETYPSLFCANALRLLDMLPPINRRLILSTFAFIHKPLYSFARKQPKKGTANAYVE